MGAYRVNTINIISTNSKIKSKKLTPRERFVRGAAQPAVVAFRAIPGAANWLKK